MSSKKKLKSDRSRAWSPEQIANRLLTDFPEDASMRISHEAIYQALYVHVTVGAKLTHPVGANLTHLGEADGLFGRPC